MSEQFEGEKKTTLESLVDQRHDELQAAQAEEDRIMKEIDAVLASTPDKTEAEKMILEKYAASLSEAMKKATEVLKAWLDVMEESIEQKKKELDAEEGSRKE